MVGTDGRVEVEEFVAVDEMEDLQINLSKKYKLYIYFIKIA
jgi:hypothetical protein